LTFQMRERDGELSLLDIWGNRYWMPFEIRQGRLWNEEEHLDQLILPDHESDGLLMKGPWVADMVLVRGRLTDLPEVRQTPSRTGWRRILLTVTLILLAGIGAGWRER